jgi:hypothetical protein
MDVQYSTNGCISVISESSTIPPKKQNITIKYILITMAKETEREEIKEETHELEDEDKDELEDDENEDVDEEA